MKFLLVCKQARNAAAFLGTVRALAARRHDVTIAIQEHDDSRDARLAEEIGSERCAVVRCPAVRVDEWAEVATLLRRLRDSAQYLRPSMRSAEKLHTRVLRTVLEDLGLKGASVSDLVRTLRRVPPRIAQRLDTVFDLAEHNLPTADLFDEFLATERPDVLLVSPLVHFGSAQADLVASARRAGVPVWMLLYSWDNLSTKGCLHRRPDLIFAWNERQRTEAEQLHGFPRSRVVVVGAPRFDDFFALQPALTRQQFHEPLGLNAARPTLLYLCSSRLIADQELAFIRRWVGAVRGSSSEPLRSCNIVVRPHPDIALLPDDVPVDRLRWAAAPRLGTSSVARPFEDPAAVVLETPHTRPQGLFESIAHSTAVVGLNTTAELEAGIVGRPVFTILSDEPGADGQTNTLHFHYLTREHGGFVSVAADFGAHVAQLDAALRDPADEGPIRSFIEAFLRPLGLDKPVSPMLADALERAAAEPVATLETPQAATTTIDAISPPPSAGTAGSGSLRGLAPVVPLAYARCALHVYATPEANDFIENGVGRVRQSVVRWLEQHVQLGDVVYDIHAGIGTYALIGAKSRGAVVVAFEPAYRVFADLCDNVVLNGCDGAVVPVPLAVMGADELLELKYRQGRPGAGEYHILDKAWRPGPRRETTLYRQPACVTRLDTAVRLYDLPRPNHLRLSPSASSLAVFAGAADTLTQPSLRTVYLELAHEDAPPARAQLESLGWTVASERRHQRTSQFVFTRGAT